MDSEPQSHLDLTTALHPYSHRSGWGASATVLLDGDLQRARTQGRAGQPVGWGGFRDLSWLTSPVSPPSLDSRPGKVAKGWKLTSLDIKRLS